MLKATRNVVITAFRDEYEWLSNFYPAKVSYGGIEFPAVEHAYQAMKVRDHRDRRQFAYAPTPGHAKRMGAAARIRHDWDDIKPFVMHNLLRQKFAHENLGALLKLTGSAYLEEGNNWHDTYWGVYKGQGRNVLGMILMEIRDELNGAKPRVLIPLDAFL